MSSIKNLLVRKHLSTIYISPSPTICRKEIWFLIKNYFNKFLWFKGKSISQFEEKIKEKTGAKYVVSFSKARVGLYTILNAMGIGKGDEVILPAYTCSVVPSAIKYAGATPIYCDIKKESFNIDSKKIAALITKKTKAIIPHHVFGQACELDSILNIAKKHKLLVIEDAAQSLGAMYKNKAVGTIADVGFFSFDYTKNISMGQGGIVVTNNKKIYEKIKALQQTFSDPSKKEVRNNILNLIRIPILLNQKINLFGQVILFLQNFVDKYTFKWFTPTITSQSLTNLKIEAYATKLPNILAEIGISQLDKLDSVNQKRIKHAKYYDSALSELGIQIPQKTKDSNHVYLRYSILCKNREKVLALLRSHQIEPGLWFDTPIYPKLCDASKMNYKQGSCPIAEEVASQIINLPNHPLLRKKDLDRVINVLKIAKHKDYL